LLRHIVYVILCAMLMRS